METPNPASQMKVLLIIHITLMIGPALFALATIYKLADTGNATWYDPENAMTFMPMGLVLMAILAAPALFNNQLRANIKTKKNLYDKLVAYQTANIIRMALFEGAALFALVVCFVTDTWINLFTCGIALLFMGLSMPTVSGVAERLELSREERDLLSDDVHG